MALEVLAKKVADILPPLPGEPAHRDFVGNEIECVYSYNPPYYAVYRTRTRVMVQFADPEVEAGEKARRQRQALLPLTALRGQINALIDGWHSAGELPDVEARTLAWHICRFLSLAWFPCRDKWNREVRKRAVRYNRRMADGIVTALEEDTATAAAQALLQEIKNDIISERTSIARIKYLFTAFAVAAGSILLILLLSSGLVSFSAPRAIWIAVGGGTAGAFFSIAIGLRGRTILIDLQNRDNIADAVLRILIGAMSGGLLLCLLLSELVHISGLSVVQGTTAAATPPAAKPQLVVFVIGFFAGFFERLVPNLLEKTNLGTQAETGRSVAAPPVMSQVVPPAVPPVVPHSATPGGGRPNGSPGQDATGDRRTADGPESPEATAEARSPTDSAGEEPAAQADADSEISSPAAAEANGEAEAATSPTVTDQGAEAVPPQAAGGAETPPDPVADAGAPEAGEDRAETPSGSG